MQNRFGSGSTVPASPIGSPSWEFQCMGCEGEGNAEENRFWGISAYGSAGGFENAIPRFGKPPKTKVDTNLIMTYLELTETPKYVRK